MTKKSDIVKLAIELYNEVSRPIDVRSVFYAAVTAGILRSKRTQFNYLDKILVQAREDGTLDPDIIYDPGRQIYSHDGHFNKWYNLLRYELSNLSQLPSTWTYPMWRNQPNYVELWFEKEGLTPIFEEVAQEWQIVCFPARGYSSFTMLKDAAERLRIADNHAKEVHILYFGDWDASGEDMDRDLQERLHRYGAPDFTFERIAVMPEQIKDMHLPPMFAKSTDSRTPSFRRRHGDGACAEVNAIRPKMLRDLASDAVELYVDTDIWSEDNSDFEDGQQVLEKVIDKLLKNSESIIKKHIKKGDEE